MKLIVVLLLLISAMSGALEARDLTLFDGDKESNGEGFALPRGISKLEILHNNINAKERYLSYDLEFEDGWTGCGWNWAAWSGEGTDISKYKNIVLFMKLSHASISNLTFQLTSKNKKGIPDGMGKKISFLPLVLKRNKYTKIVLPISKLIGGNLNPHVVWGFNIGIFSGKLSKNRKCSILINRIELTN